jgi:hypothetical protein
LLTMFSASWLFVRPTAPRRRLATGGQASMLLPTIAQPA